MSTRCHPPEPAISHNRALARYLEHLPLELIEEVIKEITFEKVIRLSSWAGPVLTQAFVISPSWRHLVGREEDRRTWQTCLRLTDDVNTFSIRRVRPFEIQNYSHDWRPCDPSWYCSRGVSFLQEGPAPRDYSAATMRDRWLHVLCAQLQMIFAHEDASSLGDVRDPLREERSILKEIIKRRGSTADELQSGVAQYQRALIALRTALAKELQRLAALYEAHPTLLKVPFAPQNTTTRAAHIPQQFRARAQRLENAPLTLYHRAHCRTYFQNDFPALVPRDWTLRLFVAIMEKGLVSSDKCQLILDGMACYFCRDRGINDRKSDIIVRTAGTPWSPLPYRGRGPEFLAGKKGRTHGRNNPYGSHTDIELTWLEFYVEVVADLVARHPRDAEAAQAEGQSEGSKALAEQLVTRMDLL